MAYIRPQHSSFNCVSPSIFRHGGDIWSLIEKGFKHEEILDFSASINPLGIPEGALNAIKEETKRLAHYPDPYQKEFRKALADYHDIDPAFIIAGNGSTELIYLVVRALNPKKVLIPVPTFSEYERASALNGSEILFFESKETSDNYYASYQIDRTALLKAMTSSRPDMVFLCNPNNPTGALLKKGEVMEIAEVARDLGIYLIVDEAFIDFVPSESVIKEVLSNPFLIVLRSMTKFYSLAGLRLGYGVFHENTVEKVWAFKEPWTVNSFALKAGIACINDKDFKARTLVAIKEWKNLVEEFFKRLNIRYIPSEVNFYLFKFRDVSAYLKSQGILIRDCSDFRGLKDVGGEGGSCESKNWSEKWFRIAVRRPEEINRLFEELIKWVQDL
jgi:threonine-phosphate decarboxylase